MFDIYALIHSLLICVISANAQDLASGVFSPTFGHADMSEEKTVVSI